MTLASDDTLHPTINLENRDDQRPQRSQKDDFETNRSYLTFSWWLLHKGWKEIMLIVEAAVIQVFGPIKPTEEVPLEKLSQLIIEVRKKIEGGSAAERR